MREREAWMSATMWPTNMNHHPMRKDLKRVDTSVKRGYDDAN
jgi:hypothetical protein